MSFPPSFIEMQLTYKYTLCYVVFFNLSFEFCVNPVPFNPLGIDDLVGSKSIPYHSILEAEAGSAFVFTTQQWMLKLMFWVITSNTYKMV